MRFQFLKNIVQYNAFGRYKIKLVGLGLGLSFVISKDTETSVFKVYYETVQH